MTIVHSYPFKKVSFYFMRHGETDWNRAHIYQGQTDTPLNATGLCQAYQVANQTIAKLNIQRICHSPLSRTKMTAAIISMVTQIPLVEIDELKEVCWGEIEGKKKIDYPNIEAEWEREITPTGGESKPDLQKRLIIALQKSLEDAEEDNTLIISHGAVYQALQNILQLANPLPSPPCCTLVRVIPPHRSKKDWSVEPFSK